jgi:lysine/ornithine N-monooxygenase
MHSGSSHIEPRFHATSRESSPQPPFLGGPNARTRGVGSNRDLDAGAAQCAIIHAQIVRRNSVPGSTVVESHA